MVRHHRDEPKKAERDREGRSPTSANPRQSSQRERVSERANARELRVARCVGPLSKKDSIDPRARFLRKLAYELPVVVRAVPPALKPSVWVLLKAQVARLP